MEVTKLLKSSVILGRCALVSLTSRVYELEITHKSLVPLYVRGTSNPHREAVHHISKFRGGTIP